MKQKADVSRVLSDLSNVHHEAYALAELLRLSSENAPIPELLIAQEAHMGLSLMLARIARRTKRIQIQVDRMSLWQKKTVAK